jgi:hypothetical protein
MLVGFTETLQVVVGLGQGVGFSGLKRAERLMFMHGGVL